MSRSSCKVSLSNVQQSNFESCGFPLPHSPLPLTIFCPFVNHWLHFFSLWLIFFLSNYSFLSTITTLILLHVFFFYLPIYLFTLYLPLIIFLFPFKVILILFFSFLLIHFYLPLSGDSTAVTYGQGFLDLTP